MWSERPQSENAFARRLTPSTGEARAVHLTRCARPDRLLPARRRKSRARISDRPQFPFRRVAFVSWAATGRRTVKESRGEKLLYARARMRAYPLLFVFSLHSFTRLPHFVDT